MNIHHKVAICFFLITAILISFWQVKDSDFINLDDPTYVIENPHVQTGLAPRGAKWAFTAVHASNWHPLTWLSHMLDVQLFGLKPAGHHLVSLLFHIANAVLLFFVLHRMTHALWQSAFVAALFALHPLHVESVAWVAERKDVLSTFFWMLTLGAYVFYSEQPNRKRYILTLSFFALGLMAKSMLVTLPFVMLLLDYWPLERHQPQKPPGSDPPKTPTLKASGEKKKRLRKGAAQGMVEAKKVMRPSFQWAASLWLIKEKIPFFALSTASCMVTYYAQKKGGAVGSLDLLPLSARIANAIVSYLHYLGKMIWPQNLAVFYPHPGMLPAWQVLGAALILLVITFLVLRSARHLPYLVTGWFWYLGTLVPVIGIVQVGLQAMADRYTYVPLIGVFLMIAWGVPDLTRKWRHQKSVLAASAVMVVAILMFNTWDQTRYWRNSITLFEHAVQAVTNNYMAHNNLGVALSNSNRKEEAASHYAEAIRLKPNYENAHYNLGNYLASKGRTAEAIAHYAEAVRLKPNYAKAHNNMGVLLASQGRFPEAVGHYEEALRIEPANASFHYNLGIAETAQSRYENAVFHFREALRIQPHYAEAHNDLGMALAIQGKTGEAVFHFREALRLKPSLAPARHNLNTALQTPRKSR